MIGKHHSFEIGQQIYARQEKYNLSWVKTGRNSPKTDA